MLVDRILVNTREEDLERRLVRLKTKLSMLKYYAHQQIHYHQPVPGIPETRHNKDTVNIWEDVIERLGGN